MADVENNTRPPGRPHVADEERWKFDEYAHAVTVISEPHRLIHDGFMYAVSGYQASVAAGAAVDILWDVPALVFPHLINVEFTFDDTPCLIEFFEDVTTSAAGSAALVQNHNRNSSNTPDAVVTVGPTVTDTGDLLAQRYIPSATSHPTLPAGEVVSGDDREWILKQGVKNLWRVTNNSGGIVTVGWHFNFYELGYEAPM